MPGLDLLRCYFQCDGECVTVEHVRKSLMRKDGVRVDHVGGLLAETDVRRLALNTKEDSCKQVNLQRKALRRTDKAVQVQKRLKA